MAVSYDELFHELDHAVSHLWCDVQTALCVTQVVAHVLLIFKHSFVHFLRV